jgi:hypothetical protein
MTLDELVGIADQAYGDHLVRAYYKNPDGDYGDDLARLIASEISETFDSDAEDLDQLREAKEVLAKCEYQLTDVVGSFYDEIRRRTR